MPRPSETVETLTFLLTHGRNPKAKAEVRALLRAAVRMRREFLPCDKCQPYRSEHEGHYACRAARAWDKAVADLVGGGK